MSKQDSRDTFRNVTVAAAVFLLVFYFGSRMLQSPETTAPSQTAGNASGTTTPTLSGTTGAAGTPATTPPTGGTTGAPVDGSHFTVVEATEEKSIAIGSAPADESGEVGRNAEDSEEDPFRMRVELSNVGASIETATMTDHAATPGSAARYALLTIVERDDGSRLRSFAVDKINIDGVDLPLRYRKWHNGDVVEVEDGQQVSFYLVIQQDGTDALKLTRTFTLPRQTIASGRHDLRIELAVENLSADAAHRVVVTYLGGLGLKQADPRFDDRFIAFGVRGAEGLVAGSKEGHAGVTDKQMLSLYKTSAGGADRLVWAATLNLYFTCTVAPLAADGSDGPAYIADVTAFDADGSALTGDDATFRMVTGATTLSPGARASYPAAVFLGEKDADSFREEADYSSRNYYYQVSQSFGFCTFTFLVEMMIWLLNGLFVVCGDFGVAIIILVLIVRAMLHPITKKGQVNMVGMQQKMGDLAPKLEELKKKFANDKNRLNQETMKLYRDTGVSPTGQLFTCLPMGIQMPIWIALYISLRNNILMRHEPFLFTWIRDLTAPDALYTFATAPVVPIVGWELPHFNLLPILLAISMYAQQKLMPKAKPNPGASDQQRQQQEMMQKMGPMMSVMMLFIFYHMPSGLNLYIMASNVFGTLEQWHIRRHIKKHEAAGTLYKQPSKPKKPAGKKPGSSFLGRLQKMAEEAQKTKSSSRAKQKR